MRAACRRNTVEPMSGNGDDRVRQLSISWSLVALGAVSVLGAVLTLAAGAAIFEGVFSPFALVTVGTIALSAGTYFLGRLHS